MRIEQVELSKLKNNPNNPRFIRDDKFFKLVESIKQFPEMAKAREIVVNDNYVILGGNMRFKAMQEAGWTEATVKVVDWSEEKQREFVIKDNANFGDWDYDVLANSWSDEPLQDWGIDLPEYKTIEEDEAPDIDPEQTFSLVGDIYQLGEHRVFCGSLEDSNGMRNLFGNKKAVATFTDPPYNIAYNSRDGKSIQNDNMSEADFQDFLNRAFEVVANNMVKGGDY